MKHHPASKQPLNSIQHFLTSWLASASILLACLSILPFVNCDIDSLEVGPAHQAAPAHPTYPAYAAGSASEAFSASEEAEKIMMHRHFDSSNQFDDLSEKRFQEVDGGQVSEAGGLNTLQNQPLEDVERLPAKGEEIRELFSRLTTLCTHLVWMRIVSVATLYTTSGYVMMCIVQNCTCT